MACTKTFVVFLCAAAGAATSSSPGFYFSPQVFGRDSNCPLGQTILSKAECQAAVDLLGPSLGFTGSRRTVQAAPIVPGQPWQSGCLVNFDTVFFADYAEYDELHGPNNGYLCTTKGDKGDSGTAAEDGQFVWRSAESTAGRSRHDCDAGKTIRSKQDCTTAASLLRNDSGGTFSFVGTAVIAAPGCSVVDGKVSFAATSDDLAASMPACTAGGGQGFSGARSCQVAGYAPRTDVVSASKMDLDIKDFVEALQYSSKRAAAESIFRRIQAAAPVSPYRLSSFDFVMAALNQTFPGATVTAEWSELASRGTVCLVVRNAVVGLMEAAMAQCASGKVHGGDGGVGAWDRSWAVYAGSLQKVATDTVQSSGFSLYNEADMRCRFFGTCSDGREGTANANTALLAAFEDGQDALAKGNCTRASAAARMAQQQLIVPLVQGLLEFAFRADPYHRGPASLETYKPREMATSWVFASALLPLLESCNASAAAQIRRNTDMRNTNGAGQNDNVPCMTCVEDGYATIAAVLQRAYPCLGITCADVGGLVIPGSSTSGAGTTFFRGLSPCKDTAGATSGVFCLREVPDDGDDDDRGRGGIALSSGLLAAIGGGCVAVLALVVVARRRRSQQNACKMCQGRSKKVADEMELRILPAQTPTEGREHPSPA